MSADVLRATVALPDGGHLAYEVHGAEHPGVPALLLRPLVGAMALWGPFLDALAARLRVVAFDPRGTGASSDAPVDATTRDLALDAVDAPDRVARLCLASAGPTGVAFTPSGLVHGAEMVAALLAPGDDAGSALAGAVLSSDVRAHDPEKVAAVEAVAAEGPTDRVEVVKHALAAARHDAREALPRVAARTLVLGGDHDELIGDAPPRELAAAIPGAVYEVIADAGHDLTLEQPEVTARRVADFFLAAD